MFRSLIYTIGTGIIMQRHVSKVTIVLSIDSPYYNMSKFNICVCRNISFIHLEDRFWSYNKSLTWAQPYFTVLHLRNCNIHLCLVCCACIYFTICISYFIRISIICINTKIPKIMKDILIHNNGLNKSISMPI